MTRLVAGFPDAAALGQRLTARGLTIAVAESCTGGLLGAAISAVAGSSRYFRGGVTAYADSVKRDLLGVDAGLLAARGAVSDAVAATMAAGVVRALGADLGLAITGIAGPGAGGTGKPVGLIYVASWLAGDAQTLELREAGDREANRDAAVRAALALGLRALARP